MMNWLDAIILGLVEGITEFLPISSTGHLIITSHFLGLNDETTKTFEVAIQLGAILAVVWLYWHRVKAALLINKPYTSSGFSGQRAILLLALTTAPAVVFGLLLHDTIKAYLFTPTTVVLALAVGGIMMILIEKYFKPKTPLNTLDQLSVKQAISVGLFQCLALWPGMSRSGSTIIGGMLCGLHRAVAAEYSFLAAIPVMFLATGYDLVKSLDILSVKDLPIFALGFVVAFVSALIAVKLFIQQLQQHTLVGYGIYRIVVSGLLFWVMTH